MQQQQQQGNILGSTTFVLSIIGSTVSITAMGRLFDLLQSQIVSGQNPGFNGSLLKILTFPSLPNSTTFFSTTAIPSKLCTFPCDRHASNNIFTYNLMSS